MLCDKCKKNNATVHTSYNINGDVYESHLCADCAKNSELRNFDSNIDSFFSDMISNFYDPVSEIRRELTCSNCGTHLSEFKESGRLGCPECYKTFKKYIDQLIANVQYGEIHTGKYVEELSDRDKKVVDLQLKLKRAVEEENYELASEIKKQIQAMKEGD